MNKNIDLTKILKDCPKGWEFYSSVLGEVEFEGIFYDKNQAYCIVVRAGKLGYTSDYTKEGFYLKGKGECTLFPSKDQRDWSKFTAPWYKKDRFDLKTLHPFDKVLVKVGSYWRIELFSHMYEYKGDIYYACVMSSYKECIPYNDETKRLVNTSEEAPKFYRNWEDWL